jgi:glycosyltransferase involved in cell wall biosynthesis
MTRQNREKIEQLLRPVELPPLSDYPLVSVLTPNYNYARYLPEAIDSVLAQTYTHFEMIVCDDGSADESCAIVQRYAQRDPRIKLVRKQNGGATSALNAAYRASSGRVVCLLDADDRYLPNKLEMVVRGFQSHPDSGFLGHRMFRIDADGRRSGVIAMLDKHPSGWYGPFIVRYGDVPGLAIASGLCLRREISDLVFPQPETLGNFGEAAITALAPLMTPLIGTSEPLTEYRCHGRNDSNGRITLATVDRQLEIHKMKWELQKEYLRSVHPSLAEAFSGFDHRSGILVSTYIHSRLQVKGKVLLAYRNLVQSESFHTLHPAVRLFYLFSVLLPRPLFRYVLDGFWGPGRLKALAWRVLKYLPEGGSHALDDTRVRTG